MIMSGAVCDDCIDKKIYAVTSQVTYVTLNNMKKYNEVKSKNEIKEKNMVYLPKIDRNAIPTKPSLSFTAYIGIGCMMRCMIKVE